MSLRLECLSHTPLHGYYDPAPEIVAEVERAQAAARARVEAFDPELVILFAPDHYNGQFYDLMPAFAIGVEARAIGDFKSLAGPLAVPINALTSGGTDFSVEIVRRQAKTEPPLRNLVSGGGALVVTVFAEVTIHGRTVSGQAVSDTARVQIDFADIAG